MLRGWRYRLISVAGAIVATVVAILIANHPIAQRLFTTYVPRFNRLDPTVLSLDALWPIGPIAVVVIAAILVPLYKPQPRRILDTMTLTVGRLVFGMAILATLGYYNYSFRWPRATLTMMGMVLVVVLPLWFVWIRHAASGEFERALIVGNDAGEISRVARVGALPYIGVLAPTDVMEIDREAAIADGGVEADLDWIGGLSRLEEVILDRDVDLVVLAFTRADRGEFFAALETCDRHGIAAKVHREFADSVLVAETGTAELVDVDIKPWDVQDYALKRAFDVAFSVVGFLVLSPVIVAIAVAIKLDDGGAVFYRQERTAGFGDAFTVVKFRTMVEGAEELTGPVISDNETDMDDPRVTRVGRILRVSHLDEIPQLWAVLRGRMSVVGPRPERPELEGELQADGLDWQRRWFVKPGLTGLAQINRMTGGEPDEKLRYDLEYIRRQSFWLDVKIVIRQCWLVVLDCWGLVRRRRPTPDDEPTR